MGRRTFLSDIPDDFDYIVHCAGLTIRKCSVEESYEFIESNILLTHEILEIARRQSKLKKFIQLSTGEVYGPLRNEKLHLESDVTHPVNAYAESKAAADSLCIGRFEFFGIPIVILRPCDVYGRGMVGNSFMPTVARNIRKNIPIKIYNTGEQKRQWLHVHDLVEGIKFSLENGKPGEIYNMPGLVRATNLDIIYKIENILGKAGIHEHCPSPPERGPEVEYGIDGRKISELGWFPRVGLIEGIHQTIS